MSNAYAFDTEYNDKSTEFIAIGHTSGAVTIYLMHETDFCLLLSKEDLKELLDLAEDSE